MLFHAKEEHGNSMEKTWTSMERRLREKIFLCCVFRTWKCPGIDMEEHGMEVARFFSPEFRQVQHGPAWLSTVPHFRFTKFPKMSNSTNSMLVHVSTMQLHAIA